MLGPCPGVHEDDRHRTDAGLPRRLEVGAYGGEVGRRLDRPVGPDALVDFDRGLVEHRRLDDTAGEDVGARLVADLQRVTESPGDEQEDAVTLSLEERVGGDGGPHLDGRHLLRRDPLAGLQSHQRADAGDRGVPELGPILGEELGRGQTAVGIAGDDVGESTAAIDPEVPPAGSGCRHLVNIPEVMSFVLQAARAAPTG